MDPGLSTELPELHPSGVEKFVTPDTRKFVKSSGKSVDRIDLVLGSIQRVLTKVINARSSKLNSLKDIVIFRMSD